MRRVGSDARPPQFLAAVQRYGHDGVVQREIRDFVGDGGGSTFVSWVAVPPRHAAVVSIQSDELPVDHVHRLLDRDERQERKFIVVGLCRVRHPPSGPAGGVDRVGPGETPDVDHVDDDRRLIDAQHSLAPALVRPPLAAVQFDRVHAPVDNGVIPAEVDGVVDGELRVAAQSAGPAVGPAKFARLEIDAVRAADGGFCGVASPHSRYSRGSTRCDGGSRQLPAAPRLPTVVARPRNNRRCI